MIDIAKKRFCLLALFVLYCCLITNGYGQGGLQHFAPVANTGITRPVQVDTAWYKLDGVTYTVESGDEIGLFDGDLCVGAVKVEPNPQIGNLLFPVTFPSILRVITPIDTLPGAIEGHQMRFRIWDQSTNNEVPDEAIYETGT